MCGKRFHAKVAECKNTVEREKKIFELLINFLSANFAILSLPPLRETYRQTTGKEDAKKIIHVLQISQIRLSKKPPERVFSNFYP